MFVQVEIVNPGDGRPWRVRVLDGCGVPVGEARLLDREMLCCLDGGGVVALNFWPVQDGRSAGL